MMLNTGDCNFLSNGESRAKKASMEGKPGMVESPGKFVRAFSISLSFSNDVAVSSYCSL